MSQRVFITKLSLYTAKRNTEKTGGLDGVCCSLSGVQATQ